MHGSPELKKKVDGYILVAVAANAATTNAAASTGATPRLAIFFDAGRPLQPLRVSRDRPALQWMPITTQP